MLHPRNLLQAILSDVSLKLVRRELKRDSGVLLSPEEVVGGIRRLLNDAALSELENVRISLPRKKPYPRRPNPPEKKKRKLSLKKTYIKFLPF